MKNILSIAAALVMTTGAAFAQTTSQAAVLGASDNAAYPLQVQGTNGTVYNCMNDVEALNGAEMSMDPKSEPGTLGRRCVVAGSGGGLFASGNGLAAGVAAGAGALVLIALVANDDDDNNNTTTTTTASSDD